MNAYEVIAKIQKKIAQDPGFAQRFNVLVQELNKIPGLQQEVIKIAKIDDPNKRQKAIDKLPSRAKNIVIEIMKLIN